MHDTDLGGVVVVAVELIVMQAFSSTIGGRSYYTPSGRAANHLGGKVVNRYLTGSCTLAAAPSLAPAAQIMQ